MRDAPGPAEDGAPAPRPAGRALHFVPPAHGRGARDRRLGVALSIALHALLLVVLITTDVVRVPDLASLLEEPVGGDGGEAVVYLPIDGFPAPRTSATPAPVDAPTAAPAPVVRTPAPVRGIPAAPVTPAPAERAGYPVAVGGGAGAGAGAGGGGATSGVERFNRAVEALRPRGLDPRLQPGSADALRTDHERAALRAYARIRALNDSILAEMAAGQRALDWTWTDEQGRRWGISPGQLHLGDITIPLPVTTMAPREQRELMREWAEIQAQAAQGAIDETFDDRVEAIRARRDAERRGDD
ncbi:MAG TPA: hypothetical protein VF039_05860 [Longimicrobiales bacterium]